jgi:hypothetical protein
MTCGAAASHGRIKEGAWNDWNSWNDWNGWNALARKVAVAGAIVIFIG